jgi:putative component of membrane protein insertase Oxa1/YidC/SpoIIIJ protein YidD
MQKLLNSLILITLFSGLAIPGVAQSVASDFELVKQKTLIDAYEIEKHQQSHDFLQKNHPSAFVRYNPATLFFGGLMWFYQTSIKEHLSSTSIFSPTSSVYSKKLIEEFGLIPGIVFTADRLTRSNRLGLYDYPPGEIDDSIHRIRQDVFYYKLRRK